MEAKTENKQNKWTTLTVDRQTAKEFKFIALELDKRPGEVLKILLEVYKAKKQNDLLDEIEREIDEIF